MHPTVFQYFSTFYLHVCGSRRQIYGSVSFLKRAQLPKANKVDLLRTFLFSAGEKINFCADICGNEGTGEV